eukprot:TRINITY_DN7462_c0_g1_i1.p1 TRINITY_DN7462_c0_g1~~TRINITY_DN7462_c0_g1_i1.p1  ORF type:complete len:468 (+),score=104.16 TRINITY_DN7462_c0_g1_i1:167-1405(+)
MAVNGQSIFPIYNNNAKYTPEKCEVDSCSNHVGQGGGQPHFHGDPFGDQDSSGSSPDKCLYGPSNYSGSSKSSHPPIIGFAHDGHLIYGRYLSTSAPGFAAPLLDACGGHSHTTAGKDEHGFDLTNYHYHTQVFDATCGSNGMCTAGDSYKASTTGPYQCFKADLTKSEGSSALLIATKSTTYKTKNEMDYRCCGMTDYYALNGVVVSDVAASSKCSAPAAPANGIYPSTSACATAGASLLSGYQCHPKCNTGYVVKGTTRCVKGTITEQATCVASSGSTTTTTTTAKAVTTATTTTSATTTTTTKAGTTTTTTTKAGATTTTTKAAATATTTTTKADTATTTTKAGATATTTAKADATTTTTKDGATTTTTASVAAGPKVVPTASSANVVPPTFVYTLLAVLTMRGPQCGA